MSTLAVEPLHGYGILRDVAVASDGKLQPPVGSLYRILDALNRDGLVAEDRIEVIDGRKRRYYRLTPAGRDALVSAIAAMEIVTVSARARLGSTPRIGPTAHGSLA